MNSFSGVRKALEYEIPRQIEVLKKGGKLIQSTRRWDDAAGITEEMRTKEHAHDYRYFPEPDLMPFEPTDAWLAEVKSRVVELPLARKQRFMRDYQLPASDAQTFVWDVPLGDYFEGIATAGARTPRPLANWVINNLRAKLAESRHHAGRAEVQARRHPGAGRAGGQRQDQQPHRPGGLRRDVRHRRSPRRHRREEGPGPGERHRRHRGSATRPSPPTPAPPPTSRPAKPPP